MQQLSRDQIASMLAAALEPKPASNSRDLLSSLAAPFPVEAISWRIGPTNGDKTKGKALAYIDSRDVQARLDGVLGADWQDAYEAMPDGSYCCRIGCKLDDEWRWRSDGAVMMSSATGDDQRALDAKEMANKGSYSDAFKRAAVKWGIGRYLYQLDAPWVEIEKRGNSVVLPEKSEAVLRRWLATWMQRNGYGAQQAPAAVEPKAEASKAEPSAATAAPAQPKPAPAPSAPAAQPNVPADGEPTAATLFDGIPHHDGLRLITQMYKAAREHLAKDAPLPTGYEPAAFTKRALDARYNEWDAWRRSMWPSLPEAEQAKVMAAVDGWSKVAKSFDTALAKRDKERAKQVAAANADPETGEWEKEAG